MQQEPLIKNPSTLSIVIIAWVWLAGMIVLLIHIDFFHRVNFDLLWKTALILLAVPVFSLACYLREKHSEKKRPLNEAYSVAIKEIRKLSESFLEFKSSGILKEIISLIRKTKNKDPDLIFSNGPEVFALRAAEIIISRHLQSGQHHMYRGTLRPSDRWLINAWRFIMLKLVEQGFLTQVEVENAKKHLYQLIKEVG
jgi:hypothetical protein